MKKISIFLTLALTIVMTSCESHDFYSKCLKYDYCGDIAIVSGIDPCLDDDSTNIIIPATIKYNGKKYRVNKIGDKAFYECNYILSISIPNSVNSIGERAFYLCKGLTSVMIPNSVTTIGEGAFSNCYSLTSVTIPNSVTCIGDYAFSDCIGLTSVTIPNSVTSIGRSAFSGCSDLTSVTIPNSVTSIGKNAFLYCQGLISVIIPNSVTSIGVWAFAGCKSLTSVTIPNSVASIGDDAFRDCTGLSSVTIPNGVKSIGEWAFAGCTSLVIQIPEKFRGELDLSECKEVIYTASKSWLYGTWKCRTPYGTIKVILREDGRMYDSTDERWYSYTIEGNRIIEQCNGYITTYNIDRANERFDCGEPGMWFYKE